VGAQQDLCVENDHLCKGPSSASINSSTLS
jgi:hypothetical protein